jgi:GNAT superfamily N-acetyltransferase
MPELAAHHVLAPPVTEQDWQAFHDIREDVLFLRRGQPPGVYDRNHPVDRYPGKTPLLLSYDDAPIGTLRLDDFGDGTGGVRLVAIAADVQGRGHGRAMLELLEERAREEGMHTLVLNAESDSVGFYEKLGWHAFSWNPAEIRALAPDCVQMRKQL